MLFPNFSDKEHGKKDGTTSHLKTCRLRLWLLPRALSQHWVGGKENKNGYTSNWVPVLEVKIHYKTVIKSFYEALNFSHPLAQKGPFVQPPCSCRGFYTQQPQTMSRWLLSISTSSLSNSFQCSIILTSRSAIFLEAQQL